MRGMYFFIFASCKPLNISLTVWAVRSNHNGFEILILFQWSFRLKLNFSLNCTGIQNCRWRYVHHHLVGARIFGSFEKKKKNKTKQNKTKTKQKNKRQNKNKHTNKTKQNKNTLIISICQQGPPYWICFGILLAKSRCGALEKAWGLSQWFGSEQRNAPTRFQFSSSFQLSFVCNRSF